MRHKAIMVLATALVLATGTSISAGDSDITEPKEPKEPKERVVPEIRAYRINPHAPVVDGNLDDAVWSGSKVQIVSDFTQLEPDEGALPTESTLVAVVYDDKALYVGFWCYDSEPDKVDRQLVRRDRHWSADDVSVRLDPFHDHQTGFRFTVNASGVMRDDRLYNENNSDGAWDAVWNSAVQQQPWGWSAEIEIPYHCLRFAESDMHTWGVDFSRTINRKAEYVKWAFTPSSEGGFVSNFGHLTGLEGIRPAGHLEVLPYVVSSFETEPTSLGNEDGRHTFGNSGVDIKYGLTSNLTLDATINPDFGQVELDHPVLNLSSYETYFPERRPFFLEGSDLWQANYNMFYSRRIGRAPGSVDDDDLLYYTNKPEATTILGAAKLSGKLPGGTSIAFLGAVTQEEVAQYARLDSVYNVVEDADGEVLTADSAISFREGVVEPRAGYSILRVKQDIFDRSSVGGIMTIAGQDQRYPAVTGALDWRLYTNNGMWYFNGQTVFSRNDPDDVGLAVDLIVGKESGEHVRGNIGLTIKEPEFDINRLGFTNVEGVRHIWSWVQYRTNDDWWIIRNSWNNFNYYYSKNWDGAEINNGANWNAYVEFTNNWSWGGGVNVQGEKYSDRETRGNGLWEWPVVPTWSWWFDISTDYRKKISFDWNPGGGTDRGGTWWANYVGVDFRPRSDMEFSLGVNYSRNKGNTRWVENFTSEDAAGLKSDTSVFADLYKEQVSINASAGMMIHRNLSIQISGQGLISGLDYRDYRPYLGGAQYGPTYADGYEHDYNWGSLNSTLLVRWEYRPGSTVYLVWTRSKSDFDDSVNNLHMSRDLDKFFSAGSTNVFLIKASYWMNI